MTTSEIQIWVGIIGSLVTIGVSVAGVLNSQRRRDRAAAVGAAFKDVVDSLASDNATLRMAAAILLRRFFDTRSEQGAAGLSYAGEALAVIAGLLRESESGPLQKVLADGLRYAPSLSRADLQGCNLTNAYLGRKAGDKTVVDLTGADLFRADLAGASLKGVNAAGAVFFGASLVNTVLSGADLTGADFRNADLTGADFRKAELRGARFDGAATQGARFSVAPSLPGEVAGQPDGGGRVAAAVGPGNADATRVRVFLGVPAVLTATQQQQLAQWLGWLDDHAVEVIRLRRDAYSDDPWPALMRLLSRADGTILLGFRQLDARTAIWRPHSSEEADGAGWWTTPWLQLEAGMAVALGHPVLVAPETGVEEGIFNPGAWGGQVQGVALSSPGEASAAWIERVRAHAAARPVLASQWERVRG